MGAVSDLLGFQKREKYRCRQRQPDPTDYAEIEDRERDCTIGCTAETGSGLVADPSVDTIVVSWKYSAQIPHLTHFEKRYVTANERSVCHKHKLVLLCGLICDCRGEMRLCSLKGSGPAANVIMNLMRNIGCGRLPHPG